MTRKEFDWEGGVVLKDHTRKKLDILKKYFRQYLLTRCPIPQQRKFKLVIVDGFSGGGLYKCGSYGSPLVFVDTLVKTNREINIVRAAKGMGSVEFECLLIMNDIKESVVNLLKTNISPLLTGAIAENSNVHIQAEYYCGAFDEIYSNIRKRIFETKCQNVLFNLDQSGYTHVSTEFISEIITSWRSSEVLLTFMIKSLRAFLSPSQASNIVNLEKELQGDIDDLLIKGSEGYSKPQWLAEAEQLVYRRLNKCAPFVSPFSINNPTGWQYWLMHFAGSYRARQVYNNVLHQEEDTQAHFGRAGLNMLSYDPKTEGQLYLFNNDSRQAAKDDLHDDIPKLITSYGDALSMEDFYKVAYSATPAHSDDIHEMIIQNPDVQVLTKTGGERRKPHTIQIGDVLKLSNQISMFFMLPDKKS